MATTVINTAGGASAAFTVRGNAPVTLAITPTSWAGIAWWQRQFGDQWQNIRQVGLAETFTITDDGTYRVWAQDRTAGSLSVTDTATGQVEVRRTVAMTQTQYTAVADPDPNTLYLIVAG